MNDVKNPPAGELSAASAPSKFDVRVHGSARDDGQEAIEKCNRTTLPLAALRRHLCPSLGSFDIGLVLGSPPKICHRSAPR